MKKAADGDRIKVHYTGTLGNGEVFDSSRDRDPLEFVLGEGQLIKDFEEAVVGMTAGEAKTFRVPAEKAYGAYSQDLLLEIPRETFPENIDPQPGLPLCMQRNDGEMLNVVITAVTEKTVTVDANHPLAGQDLAFDIEIVEVI